MLNMGMREEKKKKSLRAKARARKSSLRESLQALTLLSRMLHVIPSLNRNAKQIAATAWESICRTGPSLPSVATAPHAMDFY